MTMNHTTGCLSGSLAAGAPIDEAVHAAEKSLDKVYADARGLKPIPAAANGQPPPDLSAAEAIGRMNRRRPLDDSLPSVQS